MSGFFPSLALQYGQAKLGTWMRLRGREPGLKLFLVDIGMNYDSNFCGQEHVPGAKAR